MIKKRPRGTPFGKGNSAGRGRTKMTTEQKDIAKRLRKIEGKFLLAKYAMLRYSDLKKTIKSGNDLPCIELLIARVIERGISKADNTILAYLFQRFGWDEVEQDSGRPININYAILKNQDE